MRRDYATNLPLLADDHRLYDTRRCLEERLGYTFDVFAESEIPKLLLSKMQSVPDLVDGFIFRSIEDAVVECGWLKEEANLVAGIEKVFVASVRLSYRISLRSMWKGSDSPHRPCQRQRSSLGGL